MTYCEFNALHFHKKPNNDGLNSKVDERNCEKVDERSANLSEDSTATATASSEERGFCENCYDYQEGLSSRIANDA